MVTNLIYIYIELHSIIIFNASFDVSILINGLFILQVSDILFMRNKV